MKYVKQTVHIICQMGTDLQSPQYIKIKSKRQTKKTQKKPYIELHHDIVVLFS